MPGAKHKLPKFAGWPQQDRVAWEIAVAAGADGLFDVRPSLASWAASTQQNARNTVGAFLRWSETKIHEPIGGSVADVVTPSLLVGYVRERLALHAPTTVKYEIGLIEGALEVFAPDRDWCWIRRISSKLESRARRHVPAPRPVVHATVLYKLGLQVMRESWDSEGAVEPSIFRSGFAVALLAATPMRIANFSSLQIGQQLRQEGSNWAIHLKAGETKTRRGDIWPISGQLCLCLETYLSVVRPVLLAHHRPDTGHLWIGDSGRPIGPQMLRRSIAKLTYERLGVKINPHSFRHCAATTFALERPQDALQSSALLGHASSQTTEKHYIIQQRQLAQEDYLQLLRKRRA